MPPIRIAVVGGGISGLSAAYLLRNASETTERVNHRIEADAMDIHLFDADDRLGGHAWTQHGVDVGFQVFNLTTYPHLVGLFRSLGIDTVESEMSFSCSMDGGAFEWSSKNLTGFFAGWKHVADVHDMKKRALLLRDVLRFGREVPHAGRSGTLDLEAETVGSYLARNGYSDIFLRAYLRPMIAAIWSVPNAIAEEFPMTTLYAFFSNHHLFTTVGDRPQWRVVKGRSEAYVRRIADALIEQGVTIHAGCPILRATRDASHGVVRLVTAKQPDQPLEFDLVLFATHTDVTLKILGDSATAGERAVLGDIRYQPNLCVLHRDPSFMPVNRSCWSSWNSIEDTTDDGRSGVTCTYWINRLQHIDETNPEEQVFVTLNPKREPHRVINRFELHHPIMDARSTAAQLRVDGIQGSDKVFFCGAWRYYGFHEDGIRSAVDAVERITGRSPSWTRSTPQPGLSVTQHLAQLAVDTFLAKGLQQPSADATSFSPKLRIILPNGQDCWYPCPLPSEVAKAHYARELPSNNDSPLAAIRVHSYEFFERVAFGADIGLGEAYMDGLFDMDRCTIADVFRVLCREGDGMQKYIAWLGPVQLAGSAYNRLLHHFRRNTVDNTRRNISEHYDLGNKMYRMFLDDSMTYSCGVFQSLLNSNESLESAQRRKLRMMLEKAGVSRDHDCLEIGCGWGSLALMACEEFHVRSWTALTLSEEQRVYVESLAAERGLSDRIQVHLVDYRVFAGEAKQSGRLFDAVLSCEMVEAVGHAFLPEYFAAIGAVLKPRCKACIQSITIPNARYETYCSSSDFIRKHIFPGGHLPSLAAMEDAVAIAKAPLRSVHTESFGLHYAETLRRWTRQFVASHDAIVADYSETFFRKFMWYFGLCEGAFDAKTIDLHQLVFVASAMPQQSVASESSLVQFYQGTVMHARSGKGVKNAFTYPTCMQVVDLAQVDVQHASPYWFFSAKKRNLVAFWPQDFASHEYRTGGALANMVLRKVEDHFGVDLTSGSRVTILTTSRCLGLTFNPISVYLVHVHGEEKGNEDDVVLPRYALLEVSNTPWGERIHYPVEWRYTNQDTQQPTAPVVSTQEFQFDKTMHVSPFYGMKKRYGVQMSFSFPNTGDGSHQCPTGMELHIRHVPSSEEDAEGSILTTVDLEMCSGNGIADVCRRVPGIAMPWIAQWWIHWQAVVIWWKGGAVFTVPHDSDENGILANLWLLTKHIAVFFVAGACLLLQHIWLALLSVSSTALKKTK